MRNGKSPPPAVQGVEAVIAQLREEGAAEGRRQGEALRRAAEEEAAALRARTEREAATLLAETREQLARDREAAEEALRLAARDTLLRLRADLLERFSTDLKRMVAQACEDPRLLAQMILEVARQGADLAALGGNEPMTVLLPAEPSSLEELREDLDALRAAPLTQFVVAVTGRSLREGVTLAARSDGGGGLRVVLAAEDLEIDLSDAAVAGVLLEHLQPRFRALFEGIVR